MSMKTRMFFAALSIFAFSIPAFAADMTPASEQVAFLNAIDRHEIKAGKEAQKREVPAEVRRFAELMVTEHGQNLEQTKQAAKDAGVKADETRTVKDFEEIGEKKLDAMKKLDDAQFAKNYVSEMVVGHEEAMKKLDEFIQNSKGPLQEHFRKTREHVSMHLEQARQLDSSTR